MFFYQNFVILPTGGKVYACENIVVTGGGDAIARTIQKNVLKITGYSGGGARSCVMNVGGIAVNVDYTASTVTYVDISDILRSIFVRNSQTHGVTLANGVHFDFEEFDGDGNSMGVSSIEMFVSDREDAYSVLSCSGQEYPNVCWGWLPLVDNGQYSMNGYSSGLQTSTANGSDRGPVQVIDEDADELVLYFGANPIRRIRVDFGDSNPDDTLYEVKWWSVRHGGWKRAMCTMQRPQTQRENDLVFVRDFSPSNGMTIRERYSMNMGWLDAESLYYYSDLLLSDDVYFSTRKVIVFGDMPTDFRGGGYLEFSVETLNERNY